MKVRFSLANLSLLLGIGLFAATAGQAAADDQPIVADGFEAASVIETDRLAEYSGRNANTNLTNVQSIQDLEASVSNSSFNVDTMTTGAITIEQHALENFSGIGLFNILTGNNNAVDAAVGVSIYIIQ